MNNVSDRRIEPRLRAAILLCLLLVIAAVPYLASGVGHAYFAGDDFDLLDASLAVGWRRAFVLTSRGSYRPMVDLWFAGAASACGTAGCYHLLSLAVHLVSVGFVFALARTLFRDMRIAVLGSAMFALEPAYVQAVAWVAAIPDLLGACLFLFALFTVTQSWKTTANRTLIELSAVVLFGAALFAHESSIVALAVVPIMWYQFGPSDWAKRAVLLVGAPLTAAAFVLTTVTVYRRSYLFTESHYAFGPHMLRHGLGYIVDLYVGPGSWFAYAACVLAIILLLLATSVTRFSVLWMLVTLTPFLGFTWDNVSRYHYLPAIGFTWAVAAALTAGSDWFAARFRRHRTVVHVMYLVIAIFLTLRFARFCFPAVRSQVAWLDQWRAYAERVLADTPQPVGHAIRVDPPPYPIEAYFLSPMFRWLYQDPNLVTTIR